MEDEIKNIMSAVFGVPADSINNESSSTTIESWDSLKHIHLVVSLEEEFEITFSNEEIAEIMNYSLIKSVLIEKKE